MADLFALSSIDIEELISQYTGDIIAHQLGQTIDRIKGSSSQEKDSFVENLKNEFTTLLIAPSRSKLFKKGRSR